MKKFTVRTLGWLSSLVPAFGPGHHALGRALGQDPEVPGLSSTWAPSMEPPPPPAYVSASLSLSLSLCVSLMNK